MIETPDTIARRNSIALVVTDVTEMGAGMGSVRNFVCGRAASIQAAMARMKRSPKCPELNPVENVWQFLRDNWLSNRVFLSYDTLVDHCCEAWNRLIDQPWKIMSIGLRDWAHRF